MAWSCRRSLDLLKKKLIIGDVIKKERKNNSMHGEHLIDLAKRASNKLGIKMTANRSKTKWKCFGANVTKVV